MSRLATKGHMIILDVGSSTAIATGTDKRTFFEKAKECASLMIQRMIFSSPNDQVGVVLMGTEETNNQLNVESGGYEHICEAFELKPPSWQTLRILENQIARTNSEASWFDALVVATNYLRNGALGKKLTEFNIVLISTLSQRADVNADELQCTLDAIQSMNAGVYLISNYVLQPTAFTDSIFALPGKFNDQAPTTDVRRENERLLSQLINATEGSISNINWAEKKLSFFGSKHVRPTPWNSTLTIGTKLKMSISAYLHISEQKGPGSFKVDSIDGSSTKVQLQTEHFLNDKKIDLNMQDVIAGYMYGSTVVPYDSMIDFEYKPGDARLACLGFTAARNVLPEHMCGKGTYIVLAKKGCDASKQKLSALVHAMHEMDVAMIATKVYRKDTRPRLNALIPTFRERRPCLVMLELVFKDELCPLKFPPLLRAKNKPTDEQYDAIDKLIDSMNLMDATEDSSEEPGEAFPLHGTFNPTWVHVYRTVAHRALYPKQSVPAMGSELRELVSAPKTLADRSKPALEEVKRLFELKEVKQNTRTDWLQRMAKINVDETASGVASIDSGLSLEVDESERRTVVSVGTTTPAEDFSLLLRRGEKFATVATQMQNAVYELLFTSMRPPGDKVIAALMMYRGEAQKLGPYRYNEWMEEFKRTLLARRKEDFWQQVIVGEKLGLIDSQESDMSTVSVEQAVNFYNIPDRNKSAEESGIGEYIDADSLFDDMNSTFFK